MKAAQEEVARAFVVHGLAEVPAVPCAHIAAYYDMKWQGHKCIAWQALRKGYYQWSAGRIEHLNNLYD